MRKSVAVLAMMPVTMATQCYPRFDVRTSPGPEPMQAVFTGDRGGQPVELRTVYVTRCRPSVVHHVAWDATVQSELDPKVRVDSVVYGRAPKGAAERSAAEPLIAGGCYEVSASGRTVTGEYARGTGGFRVRPDGVVIDGTGPMGSRLANEKEVDRAAVGCRRDYRRARTAADSVTVDARVWPVSDTTITCGYLRRRAPDAIAETESTERVVLQAAAGVAAIAALLVLQDKLNLRR
jgi:hypothetical protein